MQTPFAGRFPDGDLQHGCSNKAWSRDQRREADALPLQKNAAMLNVFSIQK